MICDKDIRLSDDEKAFLSKGPRYMVRQELSKSEFKADIEKMVVKKMYRSLEEEDEDKEEEEPTDNIITDKIIKEKTRNFVLIEIWPKFG